VVGTHGKTSTSALMAWVLSCAGLNPGFMVGGIMQNLGRNYNLGTGAYFVVEGDEYDTAFFDKGPKFLHYTPSRAILTSVEFDHADIYRDFSAVRESFSKFCSTMLEEALLVGYDGDPVVRDLLVDAPCWTVRYGQKPRSPWQLGRTEIRDHVTRFEVIKRDTLFGTFTMAMVGRHNLLNALAVIAVCDDLRIPVDIIAHALKTFQGVKRRQEVRGEKSGILVMDDFAHHPTEVRATVTAVRAGYPERRLVAVFEPRTNSSMRNVFQKAYVQAFDDADLVCLRKPSRLDKVPPEQRFSSEQLVADLRERGKEAHYFQDTESIIAHLVSTLRQGDLVLIMSNGGFDNIHERLLESL
jgi:UDP-N-acetylmuramate: L-alanyl-gamma-D-glutamyl-meso-diaminopimelate ligase